MSTPLSISTPETTRVITAAPTAEQVTFWSVMGILAAAAATGIIEVSVYLIG